ncbi:MAG: DUF6134 family protein [Pseudomonadota bacterium]
MRILPLLATTIACATLSAQAFASVDERRWEFKVFLDDREIGYHNFVLRESDDGQAVDSEARFDVKFLFINAFKYRHHSEEHWVDGCLKDIASSTRANSERNRVEGQASGDSFTLRSVTAKKKADLEFGADDERTVDTGCLSTFAYWDQAFVDRDRLLNPQTGEVVPVQISRMGQEELEVSGVRTPVIRYRIETPDGEVQVCYTKVDNRWEWVRLESPIENRMLRYEREGGELPRMLSAATVDPLADEVMGEGTR